MGFAYHIICARRLETEKFSVFFDNLSVYLQGTYLDVREVKSFTFVVESF